MRLSRGEPFFFVMALVLIAVVLGGFVPAAVMRLSNAESLPVLLHVHGAVFFGWYVLFAFQARLVGAGRLATHRRLGSASVLLAIAILVIGVLVIRAAVIRPDFSIAGLSPAASAMFPFTDILNFAIAYGLALGFRRTADAHKRLMLIAGILMIDPATARIILSLGLPGPFILLLELALFVALIVYDIRRRRRPHWASVLGTVLWALAIVAKFAGSSHPAWQAFITNFVA